MSTVFRFSLASPSPILAIPREHIGFIRRISSDHPEYGEDRIALDLEIKFGIMHSPTTIRK